MTTLSYSSAGSDGFKRQLATVLELARIRGIGRGPRGRVGRRVGQADGVADLMDQDHAAVVGSQGQLVVAARGVDPDVARTRRKVEGAGIVGEGDSTFWTGRVVGEEDDGEIRIGPLAGVAAPDPRKPDPTDV